MSKILVTRNMPEKFIDQLREGHEVIVWEEFDKAIPRETLLEQSKDVDAMMTMMSDQIDSEVLENAGNLKVVANFAVGYDNFDLDAFKQYDVIGTNTPDVLTETTAELGFSIMMSLARRIVEADHFMKNGEWTGWSPFLMSGTDIFNKTVGIYGMGSIGTAFARRLQGFNCNVLYHNRSRNEAAEQLTGAKYCEFDELVQSSDIVVCTAPLNDGTKDKFNKETFDKMKESALFVNIGRGGHVVEEDLLEAIQSESIKGAALDVFREEPMKTDHPFLKEDRIVTTPHIGSATVDTRDKMIQLCVDNILNVLDGKDPITPINK